MEGKILKFELPNGIAQGLCIGEYLGAVPANDGYITGTIYLVQTATHLHHVRGIFVREIIKSKEIKDAIKDEAMKLIRGQKMRAYLEQNCIFSEGDSQGYISFDLPSLRPNEMEAYLNDISKEIIEYLE